jgi:hypothetical protein
MKQYEKTKLGVLNNIVRNCLILDKLEKHRGKNPCFPASLLKYLISTSYIAIKSPCDQILFLNTSPQHIHNVSAFECFQNRYHLG